ncbi:ATP-dependent helicase HrpB [Streptomyces sp. XM4193]|uniref:ATP-dependent helicase HrpB n=1 Tax=Streptomyces sp. XM4193 TaxID=2929782 RepID=UPI001FF7963C|nr:ATP-dependent helicase HrpB [Streptomyces sp. XM4193]MCK1796439.1 ATP-dependent helicase HrpB [Streptomyces sp. XM4193]
MERLPVRTALPALREALEQRGTAVLHAPPGTGKTTLVPPALAGLLADGAPARNVLVAEPRRLAARSAARRIAWLLGERVGESVGYTVRGERRVGPRTRVEVVTTGVLLRRLQRDPELPGTDVVLLDECHERHLDADTALAFLLDVRAALRPELRLVLASATADTDAWAELLARQEGGEPAPVVAAEGIAHPVDIAHAPPPRGAAPPHGTRVDPALLSHVAATVVRGLECDPDGDVLCFLPGVGEIARVARQLTERLGSRAEVLQLHGRAPADVQDAVLRGRGGEGPRRIVLTTSVAESSLTVPGVRVVVDSGLAREPRMDHARGLGSLVTVRVSRATAVQRAGRAGREGPGVALRCWEQAEEARRQRFPSPEIALADLTDFALQTACWGDPEARTLALLDPPPAGAMAAARDTLRAIGAVDEQGRVTARGRAMAGMGLHPRLARALLDGARLTRPQLAAEVVALIGEPPPAQWGTEVSAALREARRVGERDPYGGRWRREVRRLREALRTVGTVADDGRETGPRRPLDPPEGLTEELAAGLVVALAHPERVARGRGPGSWLMASGTRAEHRSGDGGWLAVATADRPAGAATARVRLAAELDEELARLAAGALRREYTDITLDADRGQVVARRVEALGAIELRSRVEPAPEPEVVREALRTRLREQGPEVLRWPESALRLRQRLAFLHRELGPPWPDVGDDALVAAVGERLTGTSLAKVDVHAVLTSLLPWASGAAARFEELAPERVEVPSGSRVRIDYGSEQPVLAVKLQELFGWNATPRIAGGRVPLLVHLLSPAGRPAAVTADLASFWQQGYRSVRAELRGRYPRHPWPDDPTTAQPTSRVRRRG